MGIAALLIVGGIVGFIVSTRGSEPVVSERKYKSVQPCTIFTLAEAKEVLGEGATLAESTKPEGNGDLELSTCSYGLEAAGQDTIIASVTYRTAVSDNGVKSNERGFEDNKTNDMEMVDGYGDKAYWDAAKAQFNIKKNREWIIVTNGGTDPAAATLDAAKLVADRVFN